MEFQEFDQIGRCPRLEPVAAVLSFLESVKQTERIVYAWAVRVEMIAVIVSLQPLTGLFEGLPVGPGKLLYVFAEVVNKFFFTYPADVIICLVSGNVLQVVPRLFRSLNTLTFPNLVTPARRANLIYPSIDLNTP